MFLARMMTVLMIAFALSLRRLPVAAKELQVAPIISAIRRRSRHHGYFHGRQRHPFPSHQTQRGQRENRAGCHRHRVGSAHRGLELLSQDKPHRATAAIQPYTTIQAGENTVSHFGESPAANGRAHPRARSAGAAAHAQWPDRSRDLIRAFSCIARPLC